MKHESIFVNTCMFIDLQELFSLMEGSNSLSDPKSHADHVPLFLLPKVSFRTHSRKSIGKCIPSDTIYSFDEFSCRNSLAFCRISLRLDETVREICDLQVPLGIWDSPIAARCKAFVRYPQLHRDRHRRSPCWWRMGRKHLKAAKNGSCTHASVIPTHFPSTA